MKSKIKQPFCRVTVTIPVEVKSELEKEAVQRKWSLSTLLADILEKHLTRGH